MPRSSPRRATRPASARTRALCHVCHGAPTRGTGRGLKTACFQVARHENRPHKWRLARFMPRLRRALDKVIDSGYAYGYGGYAYGHIVWFARGLFQRLRLPGETQRLRRRKHVIGVGVVVVV